MSVVQVGDVDDSVPGAVRVAIENAETNLGTKNRG